MLWGPSCIMILTVVRENEEEYIYANTESPILVPGNMAGTSSPHEFLLLPQL